MTVVVRKVWAYLAVLAGLLICLVSAGAPANAQTVINTYKINATLSTDGSIRVTNTVVYDGQGPEQFKQAFTTIVNLPDNRQQLYTISDVTATTEGGTLSAAVTRKGRQDVVSVQTRGASQFEFSYTVKGAAVAEADRSTSVTWTYVQGLDATVANVEGLIMVPGTLTLVDCRSGNPAAPGICTYYAGGMHDAFNPVFQDGPRYPGEIVTFTARFPQSVVTPNDSYRNLWTFRNAFSVRLPQLGAAAATLALGGLVLLALHRRFGRDAQASAEPMIVADFHPVGAGVSEFRVYDGIRPGQIGTVADERVDPIDITASIIDLAVRGHLLITEVGRTSDFMPGEWTLTRTPGRDELASYELTLLDAIAPADAGPVSTKDLGRNVGRVIDRVQDQLYDDVVAHGWFARSPEATRRFWTGLSWISVVVAVLATVALAWFTTYGLVGLAALVVAMGVMFVAQQMPARTKAGASLLNGLGVLQMLLATQNTHQLPPGREYQELSKLLPYAIVLGTKDRWIQAIADTDKDAEPDSEDLWWYHGPKTWHMRHLPHSMENFIITVQGLLFSR